MPDLGSLLSTARSATSASVSVVLVLAYGYIARWKELMTDGGENNISKLSTAIFLPCLLFSEVGPLSTWNNLQEYWAIVAYSLFFQLVSWILGVVGVRVFRMPQWIVPCMIFNNTTSLPLLLLTVLARAGTLDPLLRSDDTRAKALSRATVYVLINSLVGNLTRFTFGPSLMKAHPKAVAHPWCYEESPHIPCATQGASGNPFERQASGGAADEATPLLGQIRDAADDAVRGSAALLERVARHIRGALNPPLVGGFAAIAVGVVPFLHRICFDDGAFLSPFITSIKDLGSLYAVLQMFVLGGHLRSKGFAAPPWVSLVYLFTIRFVGMPALSSAVVYWVRAHTNILPDPVFDFVMIIAPAGPPALTLAAMANPGIETVTAVATTVVISYGLAPFISLTVTVALYIVQQMWHKS